MCIRDRLRSFQNEGFGWEARVRRLAEGMMPPYHPSIQPHRLGAGQTGTGRDDPVARQAALESKLHHLATWLQSGRLRVVYAHRVQENRNRTQEGALA